MKTRRSWKPSHPRARTRATVWVVADEEIAIWQHQGVQKQPVGLSIYDGPYLGLHDRTKHRVCTWLNPSKYRPTHVYGRKVIAGWYQSGTVDSWLVELDIDHPSIPWDCKPSDPEVVVTPGK